MELDDLPSLTQTLKDYDIWANKSLGQNFLLDQNITDRIAKDARIQDETVIEIGPGPGGLTRSLLRMGARRIVTLEKDRRFVDILGDLARASQGRLSVMEGDATKYSISDICALNDITGPVHIVANLPYNVGTNLLIDWLHKRDGIASMTLMFQKEVADRIIAQPNIPGVPKDVSKHYGRLSIISQYICDVRMVQVLPPTAFTPAPKVHSAVVRFVPKNLTRGEIELIPYLEKITHTAFQQRRKMLTTSLKNILNADDFTALESGDIALGEIPIKGTNRPENLTLNAFIKMAQYMRTRTP